MRDVWFGMAVALAVLACAHAYAGAGDTPAGERLYAEHCAACHDGPPELRAPPLAAMRMLHPRQLYLTLVQGSMQTQSAGLTGVELETLVAYVAGRDALPEIPATAFCAAAALSEEVLAAAPTIAGWGFDRGSHRHVGSDVTVIDAGNVARLQPKWRFGLPGVNSGRSQPVIAGTVLFLATTGGDLFALDRRTGCIHWHHRAAAPLRTALALGRVDGALSLFVGDAAGSVHAFDAASGAPRWRSHVAPFPASMLTGAPVFHDGSLIVPISSSEVAMARNPRHECCVTHGAVARIDARDGALRWRTPLAEPATVRGESAVGVRQWGPSGVPVWSTPTVDAARGIVYVGTGQNYSLPATALSDAIVALDLATGNVVWHRQTTAGDVWNSACSWRDPGPNCPHAPGPDHDFGAAVIVTRDRAGHERLLAGQKSGEVFAFAPDGELIWRRRVGAGSPLGGVHWGMSSDGERVFVPVADPALPLPDYLPRPGLYALAVADGRLLWQARPPTSCPLDEAACRFHFRLSAPPTSLPGVVIAPGLDGQLRAFASADGALLWSFDTLGEHATVNGIPARGGSIDNAGVVAAGDMLYVQSGYGGFGQLPGNVLLAFELAP